MSSLNLLSALSFNSNPSTPIILSANVPQQTRKQNFRSPPTDKVCYHKCSNPTKIFYHANARRVASFQNIFRCLERRVSPYLYADPGVSVTISLLLETRRPALIFCADDIFGADEDLAARAIALFLPKVVLSTLRELVSQTTLCKRCAL